MIQEPHNSQEHVASCEGFSEALQKGDYIHHLAHYMFAARCRAEKVDQFTKFLHLVATINFSECPTPSKSSFVCISINLWFVWQLPPLHLQPQVNAHARSNNSYCVVFWETCLPFRNDCSARLGRLRHRCTRFPSSSTFQAVICVICSLL